MEEAEKKRINELAKKLGLKKEDKGWDDEEAGYKPYRKIISEGEIVIIKANLKEKVIKSEVKITKKEVSKEDNYYFLKEVIFIIILDKDGVPYVDFNDNLIWQFRKSLFNELKPFYKNYDGEGEEYLLIYRRSERKHIVRKLAKNEVENCYKLNKTQLIDKYFSALGVKAQCNSH